MKFVIELIKYLLEHFFSTINFCTSVKINVFAFIESGLSPNKSTSNGMLHSDIKVCLLCSLDIFHNFGHYIWCEGIMQYLWTSITDKEVLWDRYICLV